MEVPPPLSVTELVSMAKETLEANPALSDIYLEGELSNFKEYSSKHWYFTLKDDESAIGAVMFRNANVRVNFRPRDGMKVRLYGRISVYRTRGAMQFQAVSMQKAGEGEILERLRRLAKTLEKEGVFDLKTGPLPSFPTSVAVVTSPDGAALRDIVKVIGKRAPYMDVLVCGSQVQGASAPQSLVRGLGLAERTRADVVIVGRGGGSLEDLLAFSDESVVRFISRMKKPVISAVGHQTDTMLSDMAADIRAATPSEAAEMVVRNMWDILQDLDRTVDRLENRLAAAISELEWEVENTERAVSRERLTATMDAFETEVDTGFSRMGYLAGMELSRLETEVEGLSQPLARLDPRSTLTRGFSMTETLDGTPLSAIGDVAVGDELLTHLKDGDFVSKVEKKEAKI